MEYSDNDNDAAPATRPPPLALLSTTSSLTSSPPMPSHPSPPDEPPPYSAHDPNPPWLLRPGSQDPRSSSTQSLVAAPDNLPPPSHRTLLLIFIHGFMGDETSFQSFPAHVHNLLSALLSDTHSVHTKIYPRYRSRRPIQIASADFSAWLQPHESPDTDIVLLGHSMGGLLSAEVALLPSLSPAHPSPFRHRLLGTMSFDTPFLGMHPGVIKSGISSLFRFESSPPNSPRNGPTSPSVNSSASSLLPGSPAGLPSSDPQDPNYNPAFPNDVRLPVRTGWKNAQHFVRKHAKHLTSATQQLVTSHLEFGGCLADLEGLKIRYCKIRMLEDSDPERRGTAIQDQRQPPQLRFINYYTASTGRPKRAPHAPQDAPPPPPSETISPSYPDEKRALGLQRDSSDDRGSPPTQTGRSEADETLPLPGSDAESVLSELSDLDTLDDTASEFSVATTAVSSTDISIPKMIIEDPSPEENSLALTAPPPGPEPKRHLPLSPFPPATLPLPTHFQTKAAFKVALKQHHDMIKKNIHAFKEQQKVEYNRLKQQAKQAPKAHKEEVKAFLEAQREEKKRFYEATKADWKSMFDLVKEEMETRKRELAAAKGTATKFAEKQTRHSRKMDNKLERLDRVCQRNQSKMERKLNKLESGIEDSASTAGYDVSTAPISETINPISISSAGSSASFSPTSTRTNTLDSTSSTATSYQSLLPASSIDGSADHHSSEAWMEPPSSRPGMGPKPKDKKFCVLPPKDGSGARDPMWVRVFMKDMDEVGAHCGLFFPVGPGEEIRAGAQWGERYAWLVQDTAERIEGWVANVIDRSASQGIGGVT